MSVVIIDYGMGNLGSLSRALEACGEQDIVIASDPAQATHAERYVLPGVGAFADGMTQLHRSGWTIALRDIVARQCPVLGICLGMQLLADTGEEGGDTPGLGLIPGAVRRMRPADNAERIPHVGWNDVHWARANALSANIADGVDFYFVHSYHFVARNADSVLATADYCGGITAAIQRHNIWGVQFHPEKSSHAGLRLLRNFLQLDSGHA